MRQTVVGVFDRYAAAQRAVQVLQDSGFGPDAVHIAGDETGSASVERTDTVREERRDDETFTGKIRHFFADLFGPDDEPEVSQYSDALRRGCAVVKVDVDEDDKVDAAREALQTAGAVDIEEEGDETGRSGMLFGDDTTRSDASLAERDTGRTMDTTRTASQEDVIPVMREEVQIGKRAVKAGGVRVYSKTVEHPVDETVTLRDEHAEVERDQDRLSSADQARMASESDSAMTQDSGIGRMTQTLSGDRAGQSMGDRGATGSPQMGSPIGNAVGGNAIGDVATGSDLDNAYRSDFDSRYASRGERWEDYEPAYRYGSTLASDSRYRGRSWDDFESDARRDWETSHPGSAWERFKDAVRHAWDRAVH